MATDIYLKSLTEAVRKIRLNDVIREDAYSGVIDEVEIENKDVDIDEGDEELPIDKTMGAKKFKNRIYFEDDLDIVAKETEEEEKVTEGRLAVWDLGSFER